MKSTIFVMFLALGACSSAYAQQAAPAQPDASDPVVLTVGSQKMTKSQFETLLGGLPPQIRGQFEGEGKRKFADQLSDLMSMAQEARTRKLDQDPEVRRKLAFQADNLLASELFRVLNTEIKVDEAAMQAYYDEHKSEYEQTTARHILVRFQGSPVPLREGSAERTEEEALAKAAKLRSEIVAGADFAEVAKMESDDQGSGTDGGSLGTFGRGRMIPEFENAAFTQPVGEISQPIKTQFGYHLIQVQERKVQGFEELKPQIEGQLKPELARKAVETIRKSTPTIFNEEYFGGGAPQAASAGAVTPAVQ